MMRLPRYFILLTLLSVTGARVLAQEAGPNPVETKLRDALRTTMLQLRDAQTQVATLQDAQTQSDKDKVDLTAKIDGLNTQIKSLIDQAAIDKATSEKAIADLKLNQGDLVTRMVDTLSTQINSLDKPTPSSADALIKAVSGMKAANPDLTKALDQYGTDIQLWTTGYDQYVQFAAKTERERAKLAVEVLGLQRVVADRETKNLELYHTGKEILDRYEKFSLGDALAAKEPFVGVTRAKLEELVQDYKDKLTAQRVTIGQAPSGAAPAAAVTRAPSVSSAK